jgi:2'-5' RNA ligase
VRLFTGIALPDDVIHSLERLLERLRPAAHLSWSPPYNLHITTKFIGEWPEPRLDELLSALRPLGKRTPIAIKISGIGWLPNPHSPRILFAGIQAGPELEQLAKDTDAVTSELGITAETRKFKPHLTLARIKDSAVPLAPLRQAIAGLQSVYFGDFEAPAFHLYLSKPGPAGSVYTQLAEIPLTA